MPDFTSRQKKIINLTGKKVGRLSILGYSHAHRQPCGQSRNYWKVKCDCGTVKLASTATLNGCTVSCGCVGKENRRISARKPDGVASFNYKYLQYKHSALKRGLKFEISKEEFRAIIIQNCVYCNGEPKMHHVKRSRYGLFISNGIDRKDSNKDYEISNCVPCCRLCNMMKNAMTEQEFLEHIKKIYYVSIEKGLLA